MEVSEMEKVPSYTDHRFVIDMMNPKDWLRHYNEGEEVVNDFILPRGPRQKDEFSDTVYHKGTEVPYHWHAHGFETFEIARGSVDCVVNGKHFIAQAGDLIHLPPYTAHGFVFLEENTIWRELFQEMDMSGGIQEKNMVNSYYHEYRSDKEFFDMYRGGKSIERERPSVWDSVPVDHADVFQCRTPEFAWTKYQGDGFEIKLKIAKFETAGCKEIWHAITKKGFRVEYMYPHAGYEMFYIKTGKLELTVFNTQNSEQSTKYIVGTDSIIDIPPYHTFSIRILEDASIYNYGGEYDLQMLLEDLKTSLNKGLDPNDHEAYLKYLRKYHVYATDISYNPVK